MDLNLTKSQNMYCSLAAQYNNKKLETPKKQSPIIFNDIICCNVAGLNVRIRSFVQSFCCYHTIGCVDLRLIYVLVQGCTCYSRVFCKFSQPIWIFCNCREARRYVIQQHRNSLIGSMRVHTIRSYSLNILLVIVPESTKVLPLCIQSLIAITYSKCFLEYETEMNSVFMQTLSSFISV